jgi:hypothetical protein
MWSVEFQQDTNVDGIGTVVATNGLVTWRDRVDTTSPEAVAAFVERCKAEAEAADCLATHCRERADVVAAALNGG